MEALVPPAINLQDPAVLAELQKDAKRRKNDHGYRVGPLNPLKTPKTHENGAGEMNTFGPIDPFTPMLGAFLAWLGRIFKRNRG